MFKSSEKNTPEHASVFGVAICLMFFFPFHVCAQGTEHNGDPFDRKDQAIIDSLVIRTYQNSYQLETLREEYLQETERIYQEKMGWLGSFKIGIQFVNLQGGNETSSNTSFVPALGISLNIDLEGLVTLPSRVRLAEAGARRVQDELMKQKRILRKWVEDKYLEYIKILEILKMKQTVVASQEEQLVLTQSRFQKGEGRLEEYLLVMNGISETKESIIRYQIEARKVYRELYIDTSIPEDLENLMNRE
ncbi:MAG: TolC family protein [Chlorobiales bacterium]|nr:TolC family protein [Chlorobiales bacterium]